MKRPITSLFLTLLIASLIAGCGLIRRGANLPPVETPVDNPTVPPNLTIPPAETPQMQPTFASTSTASLTATTAPSAAVATIPNQPATSGAQNVNLRQGPGTLFQIMAQLAEGSKVTVLGKARGDDWLYLDTGKQKGWASAAFINLSNPIATVPEQQVSGAELLHGQVLDKEGKPVDGVEFAAFVNVGKSPPDTRAHSLADGNFYLYLPAGSSGTWRVSLTGVNCKSRIMNADCKYSGAFAPRFIDVTVPDKNAIEIQYIPQ